jgi:hypothetical protein
MAVRDYYRRKGLNLEFSFDGNLVGDFGEACAVEEYGMKLVEARSNAGFDGHTPDGKRTIQVKAKGPSAQKHRIQLLGNASRPPARPRPRF